MGWFFTGVVQHVSSTIPNWFSGPCRILLHIPTQAIDFSRLSWAQMRGFLKGDFGLDEPRCAAILSLFLAAGTLNSTMISLIPANFLSYASLIRHKLPSSLPLLNIWPLGFKTMQFAWSNRETPTPLQEPRKIPAAGLNSKGKPEDQASLQSNTSIRYRSCSALEHATENASDSSVLIQNSGRLHSVKRQSVHSQLPFLSSEGDHIGATQTVERDVLKCITDALETAHCVHIFLKRKAFKKAIHILRYYASSVLFTVLLSLEQSSYWGSVQLSCNEFLGSDAFTTC